MRFWLCFDIKSFRMRFIVILIITIIRFLFILTINFCHKSLKWRFIEKILVFILKICVVIIFSISITRRKVFFYIICNFEIIFFQLSLLSNEMYDIVVSWTMIVFSTIVYFYRLIIKDLFNAKFCNYANDIVFAYQLRFNLI